MIPAATQPRKCVMIVAGEASGDYHGARLVRAMQTRDPDLFFCGIGGDGLRNAGARIVVDAHDLSVVGITEVFAKLPNLLRGMGRAKGLLRSLRPDLLILIDFPDFNQTAGRAGALLHQPPDLGLAAGPGQENRPPGRSHGGHPSLRGEILPTTWDSGDVRGASVAGPPTPPPGPLP